MRAMIFGATGYVGSHVARHLRDAGHAVSGLARSRDAADALKAGGIAPIMGDLKDVSASLALLEEAEIILFCPQLELQPEHEVVRALLGSLAGTGKTFIFTSGTGVLSRRTDGAWSEDSFAEDDPFVPSKYVGFRCETERMVRAAAQQGVRSMVIRPPLIWGNGKNNVIKAIYESGRKTGAICYMGAGLNLYSNVHVDDLAELYRLAVEKGVAGALYHAVSGEENYRSMAQCAARIMGLETRSIGYGEAKALWGDFLALIAFAMCSRSRSPRARLELGWQPRADRLDILEEVSNPAFRV